jgi:ABC-2 type transport system permease protein
MPMIIIDPNGIVPRLLSYFPFTSSVTMMVRLSTNKLDPIDILITIIILLPSIYYIIKLSAIVFRVGLLMYGKRLSFKEFYKCLKEAS